MYAQIESQFVRCNNRHLSCLQRLEQFSEGILCDKNVSKEGSRYKVGSLNEPIFPIGPMAILATLFLSKLCSRAATQKIDWSQQAW